MERNWDSIRHYEFISYPHAGIVFSSIITEFCKEISNGDATKIPMIISWLMENKQSPFGLILKVKAYRTLLKRLDMLNWDDYKKMTDLQTVANEMKYRPREFLYLDKLLIKLHAALTKKP